MEKYVLCGLCRKIYIPWSKCGNESYLCDSCKEVIKKIDKIRKEKGL